MKNFLLFLGIAGVGLYLASHLEARNRKSERQIGDEDLLDLNAAELDVLTAFHNLGDEIAMRIVENRPYATKIDLIGRMIVPPDTYELIKHDITVRHAA
jgi:DNA uptake protein ComE-like DNA-binding protein